MHARRAVLLALLFCATRVGSAAPDDSLGEKFAAVAQRTPGHIGAAAMLLETGATAAVHGVEHFPMQSVYKLPIAMAILQRIDKGELKLKQKILVTKDDLVPPSIYSPWRDEHPEGNVEVTIAELLTRTMILSDGTTSDVLMRIAGGAAAVEKYLQALGVNDIAVATTEKEMGHDNAAQYRNWATPAAFLQLLRSLHEGGALSDTSRAFLIDLMTKSKTGPQRLRGLLPGEAIVAHKTGTSGTHDGLTAATNDVGLITLPNGKHIAVAV
ncbi:MAG: class A beta-lactamase, partial [Verrucomicrobiota bacterium]|nr:class A beta-lactamase [Verrucomicrobiota bacterium]